jgi:signal peptidase I
MDFALILFVLLLVTGALWLLDLVAFRKKRKAAALAGQPVKDPWWVEYGAAFFPVILIVFVLRSFIVEPFNIPSGSMLPTLEKGDFILVNKYAYGVRLPVINKKIIDVGQPQRGEVMVFRYPENPDMDFIKRVVGLPGDTIAYQNKRLTINGREINEKVLPDYLHSIPDDNEDNHPESPENRFGSYSQQFEEVLGSVTHRILNDEDKPVMLGDVHDFPFRDQCRYNADGVVCEVPAGHYFVMGDNRDNSLDSRYWGFVPEENIVGRAFFIWLNFSNWKRIGSFD